MSTSILVILTAKIVIVNCWLREINSFSNSSSGSEQSQLQVTGAVTVARVSRNGKSAVQSNAEDTNTKSKVNEGKSTTIVIDKVYNPDELLANNKPNTLNINGIWHHAGDY